MRVHAEGLCERPAVLTTQRLTVTRQGLNCFLDNVCLVHFVLFSSLSGRVVFPFVLICSYERNKVVSVGC